MNTVYAKLPKELQIGGITHLVHWQTRHHVILQNYTLPAPTSNDPLANPKPQVVGENQFFVHELIQHNPGESLGDKLATFAELHATCA